LSGKSLTSARAARRGARLRALLQPRRFSPAQPVNHHCASYPGIQFHCEHPSSPSMPVEGIEAA
jgi:hypothetical protein